MIQPAESPVPKDQLDRFRDLLVEERTKLRDSLERLQRDAIQDNPDNLGDTPARTHLADLASETFEQEEDLGLAEQVSRVLISVNQAIERLERGTYGICENCVAPIPLERLEAIPYATRCAACQSEVETTEEEAS